MSEAKYSMLHKTLRSDILGGKYAQGELLPSENALTRRFKVSRSTVQQAFRELEKIGLISRRRGRGTFVASNAMSRKVGFIVPSISGYELFPPVLSALMRLAHEAEYELAFRGIYSDDPRGRMSEVRGMAEGLIADRVAGVVYQPLDYSSDSGKTNRAVLQAFDRAKIPVVLFDSDVVPPPGRSAYDLVSIDNFRAGETLATHLIERGAKRICFATRRNWWPNEMIRMRGVRFAVASHGHRWTTDNVLIFSPDDLSALRKRMSGRSRPDAFVCADDDLAAKMRLSMEHLGYAVPGQVMLAGFDDVKIASITTPPLTTMRQPCVDLARAAFDRLMARIAQPKLLPAEVLLPATLVVRKSTR